MATASAAMARYGSVGFEAPVPDRRMAEEQTVAENLPLVRYIAARIASTIPASVELDDLVQTGTMGLIDAVRRYDPSKGIPFPAYARYRIRGAILDGLRAFDWATRNQRMQRKAAANALWERPVETKPVHATFFSLGPVVSLSGRRESDDELPAPDVPCGENLHPDKLFEATEAREIVQRALNVLPERYRKVIVMYYSGDWSMRDIGRTLGVNESRISQIHKAALGKMKQALAAEATTQQAVAC